MLYGLKMVSSGAFYETISLGKKEIHEDCAGFWFALFQGSDEARQMEHTLYR